MKYKRIVATCVLLGFILLGGIFISSTQKKSVPDAFSTLLHTAQQGDKQAQAQVATAYLLGQGIEQNIFHAIYWYTLAAQQGDATSAYVLAKIYLTGEQIPQNIASGLAYLKQSVRQDYAPAQYMLGNLYETGSAGLHENIGQALWMWRLAADNGNPQAQELFEKSKKQYPQLAKQIENLLDEKKQALTDKEAALLVAQEYKTGKNIEQNHKRWLSWLNKAAELRNPQALYELYRLYSQPNPFVENDEEMALKYLDLAAQHGMAQAQYEIGLYTYEHAQQPQDYQVAWQWFDLAADQGYTDAIYRKGLMRMEGLGGEKNIPIALITLEQAARLGQKDAQYILGKAYHEGIGVTKDDTIARQWLKLAVQNGNQDAAKLLAEIK